MRLLFVILLFPTLLGAQDLVPRPRKITPGDGQLLVDVQTAVIAPAPLAEHARLIAAALQKTTGFLHRVRTPEQVGLMRFKRAIRLSLEGPATPVGAYRLEITTEGVTLSAGDQTGLMHGAQSLVNLLPVFEKPRQRAFLPAQIIEDHPESPRRVFHLDVGSHLYPTEKLKSLVDWLSFHKINELHLQLHNNHGWRFESVAYPQLHEVGSVRASTPPYGDRTGSDSTEYGGYYTRDNLRDLVNHAQKRGVTVVPGLSLTTGASALIAAYPALGQQPTKVAPVWQSEPTGLIDGDKSLAFLDTLLGELAEIFPAPEIRFEGPETALHEKVRKLLTKHQRKLFLASSLPATDLSLYPRPAADELLINPNREAEGGFNPVGEVYRFQPTRDGGQATLRTEFAHDFAKLEYLVFPRIAAFAEATWRPAGQLDYDNFRTRLESLMRRYRLAGLHPSEAYHPAVAQTRHGTVVRSSMEAEPDHPAELVFDGKADSFYRSAGYPSRDDHLTLEFPWPVTGSITVTTGVPGTTTDILESGVLELSADGRHWHHTLPLIAGAGKVTVKQATRFARIRATDDQSHPIVLHEVVLSEPLLAPLHEETRTIELPVTKKEIELTFRADFRDHPELRPVVVEARRLYFEQWLPLALKLGVSHFPGTPRTFHLTIPETGLSADVEVKRWMLAQMIPWLQGEPENAPAWFQSGLAALLLNELPAKPSRAKSLEGGPESAAFLRWLATTYGDGLLSHVSLDCRLGRYRKDLWKTLTQKSLEELVQAYHDDR